MAQDLGTLLARGRAAVRRNDHRTALAIFQRARRHDRDSIEALIGIAKCASRLELDYAATEAYLELAEIGIRTNNLSLAKKAVRRVLDRAPDNALALRFDAFLSSRHIAESDLGLASPSLARGTGDNLETVAKQADPAPTATRAEPREHDFAAQGKTRRAETAFVAALRKRSVGELFAATPTMPASRKLLATLVNQCNDPVTAVAQMQQLAGASLQEMSDWDAATTVAVASTNLRSETEASEPTWHEDDFPSYVESDFESPPETIQLGGPDVVLAFAKLTRESPLLRSLGSILSQELLAKSHVVQSFGGQVITRQGAATSSLYLVLTGRVHLERENGGGAHHVASLLPGDFFGEDGVLGNTTATANARVTAETLLLEIGNDVLAELATTRPEMLSILSEALRTRLLAVLVCDRPELAALGASSQAQLLEAMEVHKATSGGIIAGRRDSGLWFLVAGQAERWDVSHSMLMTAPTSFAGSESEVVATQNSWLVRLPRRAVADLKRLYPRVFGRLGDPR